MGEIVFHYAPSREHRHVEAFLGDFSGTLLSDGYQGYEAYAKARGEAVVHAGCWSHARREFVKIRDLDPVRCDEALDLICGLYAEEEKIRGKKLAGREKLLWRREHSRPLVEAFWRWCDAMADDMTRPPQDPLLKAIAYARNHRSGLEVCLQDPDVPIDTDLLERCVRPVALGRRNWLFCWSGSCRDPAEPGADMPPVRRRYLHVAGGCPAAGLGPSRPGRGLADAAPVKGPLRRQPDDIRRQQGCAREGAASGLTITDRSGVRDVRRQGRRKMSAYTASTTISMSPKQHRLTRDGTRAFRLLDRAARSMAAPSGSFHLSASIPVERLPRSALPIPSEMT